MSCNLTVRKEISIKIFHFMGGSCGCISKFITKQTMICDIIEHKILYKNRGGELTKKYIHKNVL